MVRKWFHQLRIIHFFSIIFKIPFIRLSIIFAIIIHYHLKLILSIRKRIIFHTNQKNLATVTETNRAHFSHPIQESAPRPWLFNQTRWQWTTLSSDMPPRRHLSRYFILDVTHSIVFRIEMSFWSDRGFVTRTRWWSHPRIKSCVRFYRFESDCKYVRKSGISGSIDGFKSQLHPQFVSERLKIIFNIWKIENYSNIFDRVLSFCECIVLFFEGVIYLRLFSVAEMSSRVQVFSLSLLIYPPLMFYPLDKWLSGLTVGWLRPEQGKQ